MPRDGSSSNYDVWRMREAEFRERAATAPTQHLRVIYGHFAAEYGKRAAFESPEDFQTEC